ncbi:MAG TPA: alpha/beta hydrolase, partial [Thermoanaerobaculia bacterium]
DSACRAAFPHLREELQAVMARIDQGVTVAVIDPSSGRTVEVRPTRGLVAEGIRFLMYGKGGADLPRQIHAAAQGDLKTLVKTALDRRKALDDVLAMGMFLSVTCAEDLPFITADMARRATAGTLLGDYRIAQQKRACTAWPRGDIPRDAHELVRSDVPVLLLSGERDPVTPPEFGERVAKPLRHGLHLVVPRGGHGGEGACVQAIERQFLAKASVQGLDTSCLRATPPTRFNVG